VLHIPGSFLAGMNDNLFVLIMTGCLMKWRRSLSRSAVHT